MKTYITYDLNDPTKLKIESRTQPPPQGFICLAPEGEELEWLDIVDVKEDENSPATKMAIINMDKKHEVLAARAKLIADNEWIEKRQAEYPSLNEMVVALWEKVMENRPESADVLQAKRVEVKLKYPKPIKGE